MSDLFELRQKVEEGAQWRGTITVMHDDDALELSVRQLRDPEFWEVMSLIDQEEVEALQDQLPDEKMDELRELRDKDDLSEEEEQKLQALQDEIEEEDIDLFSTISLETFNGLRKAAKYAIEPDQTDIRSILAEHGQDIDDAYGRATEEEARKWFNDKQLPGIIDRCTDFVSFTIGIQALTETIGDTGNSND